MINVLQYALTRPQIRIEDVYRLWKGNGLWYLVLKSIGDIIQICLVLLVMTVLIFYNFNWIYTTNVYVCTEWWRWVIFGILICCFVVALTKHIVKIKNLFNNYYRTHRWMNKKDLYNIFNINDWEEVNGEGGISQQLYGDIFEEHRNELNIFGYNEFVDKEEIEKRVYRKLAFTDDILSQIFRGLIERRDSVIHKMLPTIQTHYFIKCLKSALNKTTKRNSPNKFTCEHYIFLTENEGLRYVFKERFNQKIKFSFESASYYELFFKIVQIVTSLFDVFFFKDFTFLLSNSWSAAAKKILHYRTLPHTTQYNLNDAVPHAKNMVSTRKSYIFKNSILVNGDDNWLFSIVTSLKGVLTTGIVVTMIYFFTSYSSEALLTGSFSKERLKAEKILNYQFVLNSNDSAEEFASFYFTSFLRSFINELLAPIRVIILLNRSYYREAISTALDTIWDEEGRFRNENSKYLD
ncbi:Autophagy-related protein 9 [Entamoeba marina]